MSLPNELLDTAKYLLQRERTKPKQATLRRAISTAYYALFHLLIEEASAEFLRGKDSRKLQKVFRRVFEHTEMKEAAKSFANSALPDLLANVLGTRTVSPDLQQVATIFMNAQNKRHQADAY